MYFSILQHYFYIKILNNIIYNKIVITMNDTFISNNAM